MQETDEQMVERIVQEQCQMIRTQEVFRNDPLAQPGLTPQQREKRDAEWQQMIDKGLHLEIKRRVQERMARSSRQKPLELFF